jgi:adenine phosphoribosyltransferase
LRLGAEAREGGRLTESLERSLRKAIRIVPDYPRKGVSFKDLTTLWKDGALSKRTIDALAKKYGGERLDKIVGIEARGFIVGAPLADRLGIGFVPARKVGKLPSKKLSTSYELEYSKQGLEIHTDGISRGDRVLIVDDLLATGGTADATRVLVERLGGEVVGFAFVAELRYLNGRAKLPDYRITSLVGYDSE